ncbi:MAG: type III pantothenate kinase [Gallionella sp.]|nr:type III pantothenate kinase [Gallionella sp.]
MRLLIDAGNTRIKWALVDGQNWLRTGTLAVDQASTLAQLFADVQGVQQIWISNVAGEGVARHIRDIGSGRQADRFHFIVAQAAQCGVRNGYSAPSQLGSDRWAALIAAWHLVRGACLVVNSGTATTVDALSATGEFIGGLILPGVELMQRSLNDATAQLSPAQGIYAAFPRNTADALFSGAIQACCGAIERQHALLGGSGIPVVLSGGGSAILSDRLNLPLHVVDNLVLQGLLLIAQEADTQ